MLANTCRNQSKLVGTNTTNFNDVLMFATIDSNRDTNRIIIRDLMNSWQLFAFFVAMCVFSALVGGVIVIRLVEWFRVTHPTCCGPEGCSSIRLPQVCMIIDLVGVVCAYFGLSSMRLEVATLLTVFFVFSSIPLLGH
jgi:hypothetical protein